MHDYFERLFPHILDIQHRDRRFWSAHQHQVQKVASLNNFAFIYEGRGTLEVQGETYPIKRRHVFHFAPGEEFCIHSDAGEPLSYIAVHFQHFDVPEQAGMPLRTSAAPWPFPPVMAIDSDQKDIPVLMENLLGCWSDKNAGFEWKARVMFLNILRKLADWYGQVQQDEDENARLIVASMEYIKQNFCGKLERDELAQRASISASYYSVLFKRYSGYSVVQYITKLRMDKAKQLLRGTRAPVSEIAREVGYPDPLYFARRFSQDIGMSPREYRNS
jgi:AraC-like DNA-binding protein